MRGVLGVFYYCFGFEESEQLERCMLCAVRFFNGGVQYEYLRSAPLPELLRILEQASAISKELERDIKRASKNGF